MRILFQTLQACKSLIDVGETDVLLSFLPLSHVFERLGGHYVPLFSGAKIAYAESTFTVARNMQEVSPTVMLSVPRLYETMHDRVLSAVQAGSPLKTEDFPLGRFSRFSGEFSDPTRQKSVCDFATATGYRR